MKAVVKSGKEFQPRLEQIVVINNENYWNVITTSQKDLTVTPHHFVSTTSQTSLKWNTQRRLSGTLPRRLSGTYPRRPISTSLRRLL